MIIEVLERKGCSLTSSIEFDNQIGGQSRTDLTQAAP